MKRGTSRVKADDWLRGSQTSPLACPRPANVGARETIDECRRIRDVGPRSDGWSSGRPGPPSVCSAVPWLFDLLRRDHHRYQIAVEGSRDAALTVAPAVLAVGLLGRRPVLSTVGAALTAQSRPIVVASSPSPAPRPAEDRTAGSSPPTCCAETLASPTSDGNWSTTTADVVVLQELSDEHMADLSDCGLLDAYPHHVLDPTADFHGSAVLSRWPLSHQCRARRPRIRHGCRRRRTCRMASCTWSRYTSSIRPTTRRSRRGGNSYDWLATYVAGCREPVVLAGDFNATLDHRPLQALLDAGLTDAHAQVGMGLGLTWPQRHWGTGRGLYFPVMRLDHVLVSEGLSVRSVRTSPSAGSDHRRVLAEIAAPGRAGRTGRNGTHPG